VIVQGADMASVMAAVRAVGGEVTHELGVINAVGARLTPGQVDRLEAVDTSLRLHADRQTTVAGRKAKKKAKTSNMAASAGGSQTTRQQSKQWAKEESLVGTKVTAFPTRVGADRLHAEQIMGGDVAIAVIDTGVWSHWGLEKDSLGVRRISAVYDAVHDAMVDVSTAGFKGNNGKGFKKYSEIPGNDYSGHGSHVASVAVGSSFKVDLDNPEGAYNGIAPDAELVVVKAFDSTGQGTYADVIRGLDWVIQNKDALGIRVLNLSFSASPQSHYWDDPLNQAVMRAWQAGIVVVASAGNTGPDPMTVGVPGNVPYVITVGAMTDNFTRGDYSDDRLTSFSAAGPTHEGFVKPDLVAPGGHILGLMDRASHLPTQYPQFHDGASYFAMSGTSQATAVVSGIVALMIQVDPLLTPNEVKYRLMTTARPALDGTGQLAYSIFQQGTGLVDAYAAVHPMLTGFANQGLDLAADLAGSAHYQGRANRDADGNYYLEGVDGFMWNDGFMWSDAMTESMSINTWVDQQ